MRQFIVGLVIAILIAIFALQNSSLLRIHALFWTFPRISESLVILGSVLFGAILGAIFAFRERRSLRRKQPSTPPKPENNKPETPPS